MPKISTSLNCLKLSAFYLLDYFVIKCPSMWLSSSFSSSLICSNKMHSLLEHILLAFNLKMHFSDPRINPLRKSFILRYE